MKQRLLLLACIVGLVFTANGCVVLAGVAVYKVARKVSSGPSKITKEERKRIEFRYVLGTKEKILNATKEVLEEWDYLIQSLDNDKGIIEAENEEYSLSVKAKVEEIMEDGTIGFRIVIQNNEGIVENKRLYDQIFSSIHEKLK